MNQLDLFRFTLRKIYKELDTELVHSYILPLFYFLINKCN